MKPSFRGGFIIIKPKGISKHGEKRMNKRIATLIFGILLMGIVSAGLVSYLSNAVTGSVEVRGPAFYLDNINVLSGKPDSGYLRLNDNNVIGDEFTLGSNKFYSDSLGVDSFYPLDFKITLNAKVSGLPKNETTGEILETCSIQVIVYQASNSGSFKRTLCEIVKTGFDNEEDYEKYEFNCIGNSTTEINFNEKDRFELLLVEECPSYSIAYIELKGNSYIQVVAK